MDDKVKSLAQDIAMWKKYNQTLIAEDVLNMMLDKGLLSKEEMKEIVDTTNYYPKLPNKHFPLDIPEKTEDTESKFDWNRCPVA